jgi:hypothetical protein
MTVVTKQIKNVPLSVPGEGLAEIVRRVAQWHKSPSVAYSEASGAINLFELPGNAVVLRVNVNVTTAFDASGSAAAATGTITVPNDSGTLTLWDAGNTKLQSTGMSPSTSAEGAVVTPSSGGMVIFTYTTSTSGTSTNAAGAFEVYLELVQLADRL